MNGLNGFLGDLENEILNPNYINSLESIDDVAEVMMGLGATALKKTITPKSRGLILNAQQQAAARVKTLNKQNPSLGIVKETKDSTIATKFENRINEIEDALIVAQLIKKELSIVDHEIYTVKKMIAGTNEMFRPGDARETGHTNINKSQLPSGNAFLVTHIAIESGVCGTPTGVEIADGKTVAFSTSGVKTDAALRNAEYDFKNGQKVLGDDVPLAIVSSNETSCPDGFYELKVPKMIQNAKDIIFDIKLAGTPVANTYVKVRLRGAITAKR